MTIYNLTNMTTTNLYDASRVLTDLEPTFMPLLLFAIGGVAYLSLSPRYSFHSSMTASLFIMSLLAVLLRPTGVITDAVLIGVVALTAGFGAWGVFAK